ncbi:hypothetical protein [Sphingomonas hengshuiensis]|uniref:hypothetical protein n=1 Tax=Sphingomonas hengshuiensis TaxID=1609977 RepID=UPI000696AD69|nr:hypothetical protein [Sphingomonas hengshuiensis]
MQNRVPVARAERRDLPDFAPVPRKGNRHDGWTPARQKAFVEALADTGSVRRAAAMVNMAQANAYALRRAAGAEGFRRAWDAALDFGLARLKDAAFERAIEGELIPVFDRGKLMGFRRKRNDALLMFCLRHYGQDASGRRTTINTFSRASAGAAAGEGGAAAASATVRTVITGAGEDGGAARADALAAALEDFAGVTLDPQAEAGIAAVLAACAERQVRVEAAIDAGGERGADAVEDDPDEPFVRLPLNGNPYRGTLEPVVTLEDEEDEGEWHAALPPPAPQDAG